MFNAVSPVSIFIWIKYLFKQHEDIILNHDQTLSNKYQFSLSNFHKKIKDLLSSHYACEVFQSQFVEKAVFALNSNGTCSTHVNQAEFVFV